MFIFSNLATSIDGKIATSSRVHFPIGSPADRKLMHALRKKADAVIIGASTLRAFKRPIRAKGSKKNPVNVILSSNLKNVSPYWPFFKDSGIKRILFVSGSIPSQRMKSFQKTSDVIHLKNNASLARQMISILRKYKLKRILVEGGGELMWEFVKLNLIDEYYLTLTPKLVGGRNAPTLLEGDGFPPSRVLKLKLSKWKKAGSELFLIYRPA